MGGMVALILGVMTCLCGCALLETAYNGGNGDFLMTVGTGALGMILIVGGGYFLYFFGGLGLPGRPIDYSKDALWMDFIKGFKNKLVHDDTSLPDETDLEKKLTDFKPLLTNFFKGKKGHENDDIQSETTQLFWNILDLHRTRLEKREINLDLLLERRKYSQIPSVTEKSYFDGKYFVKEVGEEIAVSKTFSSNGKKLFTSKNKRKAYYTILEPKNKSQNEIICPSCGNVVTQTKLIEGCDFCKAQFSVEDLRGKVSGFAFRDDYKIQYEKYKEQRSRVSFWTAIFTGIVVTLLGLWGGMAAVFEMGGSIFTAVMAVLGVGIACTIISAYLLRNMFFSTIQPIINKVSSLKCYTSDKLKEMENAENYSYSQEKEIKRFDEMFSLNGFFLNVQNKLEAVHYAESISEINAFSDIALDGLLASYKDVIDVDVLDMALTNHYIENGMQTVILNTALLLTEKGNKNKISTRKEEIRLKFVKNVKANTKAVYIPSLLQCLECSSKFSPLYAKNCPSCNKDQKFSDYDWSIVEYNVLNVGL